jgi:hypothetical protein
VSAFSLASEPKENHVDVSERRYEPTESDDENHTDSANNDAGSSPASRALSPESDSPDENCEKSPLAEATFADGSLTEKSRHAIRDGQKKPHETQETIVECIREGEHQRANDIASCGEWWHSYGCNDCGGDSHRKATCNYPELCPDCASKPGGDAQGAHAAAVATWDSPTYMAFYIHGSHENPAVGREKAKESLKELRKCTFELTPNWLKHLRANDPEFARRVRREYYHKDREIPFGELIPAGIAGRHSKETNSGQWRIHLDVLADARYIPLEKLKSAWESVGGVRYSVQLQRVTRRFDGDKLDSHKDAVLKALAYVTDKIGHVSEGESVSPKGRVSYYQQTKGSRRSIPFGALHPNSGDYQETPEPTFECPHCGSTDLEYCGLVESDETGDSEPVEIRDGSPFAFAYAPKENPPPD